jgi:HAD superfamily hydrolase (TIGR01509 family)
MASGAEFLKRSNSPDNSSNFSNNAVPILVIHRNYHTRSDILNSIMTSYVLPVNIKYLLFDMDGTLVDTEPVGPKTFLLQLSQYGVTPTNDERELFLKVWRRDGTELNEVQFLTQIVEKYKIDILPQDYIKDFFELYENKIIQASPLPGVDSFLKTIYNTGKYKLCVVTASKLSQAQAVLKQNNWTNLFDEIVSEEDITKHKPDPEPFLTGLDKLGATAGATLVFEDSKNGAISGKKSGCIVVGVRAGNMQPQNLKAADVIVDTFNDIKLPPA